MDDASEGVENTSSDSDSDYFPETATKSRGNKKSEATGIKKLKREVCSNRCASTTTSALVEHTLWVELPLELLVIIFQYIVQQFGPFLTLKKYGLVCKKWRLALLENALWQHVTLNCEESWLNINQALKWLSRLNHCTIKKLTVLSWKQGHSNTSFQQLLQICLQVKCMEFNKCVLKFDEVFSCLHQVEEVTIEQCNVKSFNVLVQGHKDKLHYLSLTEVGSSLCQSLLKCETPLVKLKTLKLDNFGNFRADSIKLLQKMCPNLIDLQLTFARNTVSSRCIPSEADLNNKFLCLKCLVVFFPMFDTSLHESDYLCLLLATSPNLQSLILVHYIHSLTISYDKLVSLLPSSLTEFALFFCVLEFDELLSKVLLRCDSLQHLTIASPRGWRVNDDIITTIVTSPCVNTLQYLDLRGTDVTINGVRTLLTSAYNLKHLNLLQCRYLPRGTRRLYDGATELNKLL